MALHFKKGKGIESIFLKRDLFLHPSFIFHVFLPAKMILLPNQNEALCLLFHVDCYAMLQQEIWQSFQLTILEVLLPVPREMRYKKITMCFDERKIEQEIKQGTAIITEYTVRKRSQKEKLTNREPSFNCLF